MSTEFETPETTPPVLIIESDHEAGQLFSKALERSGYHVLCVASSTEALHVVQGTRVSAILLSDLPQGELDGLSLLRRLRLDATTATLPVLIVAHTPSPEARVRALRAGSSDYLATPIDLDELVARVHSQLRGQAAWMSRVESYLRERSAITRALGQIQPGGTPESTAAVVCFELSLLHHLPSVALFVFETGETAKPLSRHGIPLLHERLDEPLSVRRSRYLISRATRGPWTESGTTLAETLDEPLLDREASYAFAPLFSDSELLGVLGLSTGPHQSGNGAGLLTAALSSAIDFAGVSAGLLAPLLHSREATQRRLAQLDHIVSEREFWPVFQPIVDLRDSTIVGYETLTRFSDGARPDTRFLEANSLGRGVELELATLRYAIEESRSLSSDVFLSANISPATLLQSTELRSVLARAEHPLVLELTEHERIDDYESLRQALRALGPDIKWSVDDTGSGFASLRHVLSLEPHFVKLDLSLVRNIHEDPARQALVAGIEYFATETGSHLIAEGIEYVEERTTLQRLDVELGQGYLLGKPEPLTVS